MLEVVRSVSAGLPRLVWRSVRSVRSFAAMSFVSIRAYPGLKKQGWACSFQSEDEDAHAAHALEGKAEAANAAEQVNEFERAPLPVPLPVRRGEGDAAG